MSWNLQDRVDSPSQCYSVGSSLLYLINLSVLIGLDPCYCFGYLQCMWLESVREYLQRPLHIRWFLFLADQRGRKILRNCVVFRQDFVDWSAYRVPCGEFEVPYYVRSKQLHASNADCVVIVFGIRGCRCAWALDCRSRLRYASNVEAPDRVVTPTYSYGILWSWYTKQSI